MCSEVSWNILSAKLSPLQYSAPSQPPQTELPGVQYLPIAGSDILLNFLDVYGRKTSLSDTSYSNLAGSGCHKLLFFVQEKYKGLRSPRKHDTVF